MLQCGSYTMKLKDYLPSVIYQCKGCQQTLSDESRDAKQFDVDAKLRDLPPFLVQLEAPAVTCPRCGRQNLIWSDQMRTEVEGALADAFS